MYIISKHKDYYDGVAGTEGIDKERIYIRKSQYVKSNIPGIEIINKWKSQYFLPQLNCVNSYNSYITESKIKKNKKNKPDYYNWFIIGFCGKLYLGYFFKWNKLNEYDEDKLLITYDPETIRKHTIHNFQKTDLKLYLQKFQAALEYISNINVLDLFRTLNAPVFVFDPDCRLNKELSIDSEWKDMQVNPLLKTYEFAKAMPAYLAFQELSMFIGNVLIKPESIPEIDQKYRLTQRGMDDTSFRQVAPGDKKEKRRANKARKKNRSKT